MNRARDERLFATVDPPTFYPGSRLAVSRRKWYALAPDIFHLYRRTGPCMHWRADCMFSAYSQDSGILDLSDDAA